MNKHLWVFIAMLLGLRVAASFGAEMKLGDLSDWRIAVSESAIPAEKYAAEEFQRLYRECCGVDLEILSKLDDSKKVVFIGPDPSFPRVQPAVDPKSLGDEGLEIQISPERILISGGRPRGTLYAVYEFFEKFVGVRFLTHDHTHYPPEAKATVLPAKTHRYASPFSFRWSYYKENSDRPDFAARLRCNTVTKDEKLGGVTPQELINHTLFRYINPEKYGESNPEYFALVDGVRKMDVHGGGPEPCVTNPEVIEIVAKGVIEDLDASPGRKNISVSQNDNDAYCRCAACEAVNQREGTPMGSHLAFVNAVAERVEKKHPDVKIGTLAYWYTRKAPKTIRPHHTLQIQLCSIECCTLHPINDPNCKRNQEFCQDVDEWNAISDEIWIWNYNTNFSGYDLPFPNLRSIGPNVRFFRDNKAKGIFMQANGNGNSGEFCDLRNHLISRLLWDPDQDDAAIIREFCELHYGKAAPVILEYIDLLHDNAEKQGVHPGCFPTASEVGLTREVVVKARSLFDRALELAENETVRNRVEKASVPVHKAMVSTHGNLKYRDGRCYHDFPPGHENAVEEYIRLARKHGVTMTAETVSAETYFAGIEHLSAGVPALRAENDVWRATLLPEHNGRIIELIHKPTSRNIVHGDREFARIKPFEEWRMLENWQEQEPVFQARLEGNDFILEKLHQDGTRLTRKIELPDDGSGDIRFSSVLVNEADQPRSIQLKVHPEYDTVTGSEDPEVLSVWVLDAGKWLRVNDGWQVEKGPREEAIRNAKGGGFGFFNHEAGYGIVQSYAPEEFSHPRLWWSPSRKLLNLELLTLPVELAPGEKLTYSYRIEYIKSAPGS